MNSTLYNGYSGIKTHQFGLDSVSNNIANINTTGYRANMPEFKSLFSNGLNSTNPNSPVSSDMNYGSTTSSNAISNINGNYIESDGELNVAYAGKGWFVVGDNEGNTFNAQEASDGVYFTRDGSFSRDAEGYIVNAGGYYMMGVDLGKIKDNVFVSNTENDSENLALGELKPLQIPQDLHYGPTETTKVNIALNLNNTQSIQSMDKLFTDEAGNIDEAQILNTDINALVVNNANINATAYNDVVITIDVNGEKKDFHFEYGSNEGQFSTIGELIELVRENTGLDMELSKNPNGSIDKNITLEVKNNSFSDMEVTLDGKLFNQLGLKGTKSLNNIEIPAYNASKNYNANDLVKVDGAIFMRLSSSGNSSPLEDSNAWVMVDSNSVRDFSENGTYNTNDLVKINNQIYQKLSNTQSSDVANDAENWRLVGENATMQIEQFNQNNEYAKNSLVYYNNNIYQKISDSAISSDKNPNDDILNWKMLGNDKFLSDKLNVANYKTTTEFFNDSGDKLLIISEFVLYENTADSQVWNVKSAIYDKDGKVAISPIQSHNIRFDSNGNVQDSKPITLSYGDKSVDYGISSGDNKKSTNLSYIDSSVLETSKDGTQKGDLVNIGIDNNGVINLSFSNGITESMGRVGIVAFVNDQGLQKVGGNLFEMTSVSVDGGDSVVSSGEPLIGWDENGALRFGQVLHKYLETSNVNPANAMTDLIVFQRGYAMNAKAFTTGDDLIKEAINLKR